MKHLLILLLCCTLVATSSYAQDEQEMPDQVTLVFSQNKVKMGTIGTLSKMVQEMSGPVMNDVVKAGHWIDWGVLTHNWGDEWNFNIYYVAADMGSFMKGWDMFTSSMMEKHPDSFGEWQSNILEHKDNIYTQRMGAMFPMK